MIDQYGEPLEPEASVPPRALVFSLVALSVAGLAAIVWPSSLDELAGLVWLLALAPAFLLAYYRGWEGAAAGLLTAMILMIAIEIVPPLIVGTEVDWRIAGGVTVVFIAASLGLGGLAEVLRRQKRMALQLAFQDTLTGLPNRVLFLKRLGRSLAEAIRTLPPHIATELLDALDRELRLLLRRRGNVRSPAFGGCRFSGTWPCEQ